MGLRYVVVVLWKLSYMYYQIYEVRLESTNYLCIMLEYIRRVVD